SGEIQMKCQSSKNYLQAISFDLASTVMDHEKRFVGGKIAYPMFFGANSLSVVRGSLPTIRWSST
ncbi:hypothetical protein HAX54_011228, partial [Datura stramonium]|nr:hypothetical protein [Datura stramonium]